MLSPLDLPTTERPRERLLTRGPAALSDHELVAVLLGTGHARANVSDLAATLLSRFGDLDGLVRASSDDLDRASGIGSARACLLHAAFELGRRVAGSRPQRGRRLGHAAEVWTHLRARLCHKLVEEFWVLGLDARHRVKIEECVAIGSLTGVEVHPREVFRPLIHGSAAAAILCHNHPSGDPTPSGEDIHLTTRLREVGTLCGIAVLDHVVVATDGFVSLAERGWI